MTKLQLLINGIFTAITVFAVTECSHAHAATPPTAEFTSFLFEVRRGRELGCDAEIKAIIRAGVSQGSLEEFGDTIAEGDDWATFLDCVSAHGGY